MNWRKQILLGLFFLTLTFALAGCWDGVELEDRAFAVAVGIDAKDGQFEFTAACARLKSDMGADDNGEEDGAAGDNGEEDGAAGESASTQQAQGQRLIEAIQSLDARSSRKLFLGQAKTAVFSKNLLENEQQFREALNVLESRSDIDRSIDILATVSNVADILNASPPGESKPGYYVVNSYRMAQKSGGKSFQQSFEPMLASLRESGAALLPLIKEEGTIEGAAVVQDYRLAGELDGTELRGLLWAQNRACLGAIITDEGQNIPMTVRRHRSDFHFSEADGTLRVIVDVRIKGEVASFWGKAPPAVEYEQLIAKEMESSIQKIQQELKADALGLRRALQKEQYPLYLRYADSAERWEQTFAEMKIVPFVRCDVQIL